MSIVPRSYVEKDAVKNAAADKVLKTYLAEEDGRIDKKLSEKAGRKALANRHLIAIDNDGDDGYYITGTAAAYYKKHGTVSERMGLVNALLPMGCKEVAEMTWQFDEKKTLREIATILRNAGFKFDKKFQNSFGDKKFTGQIEKIFASSTIEFNKKAKKKAPVMKAAPKKSNNGPNLPPGRGYGRSGGCMGW